MAFCHFLAIFPALLMIHVAARHLPGFVPEMQRSIMDGASKILPHDVVETIYSAAGDFHKVQLPGCRLLGAFAGVAWAGCNGTWAMIYGLNTAYELRECRRAWQLSLTIVGLTIALTLIATVALGVVVVATRLRASVRPCPIGRD